MSDVEQEQPQQDEQPQTNVVAIEFYQNDAGEHRWRAKAGNGEIVAHGEAHTRQEDAIRAAQGVFPSVNLYVHEDPVA